MNKSNCIYLITPFPIFNPDAITVFEGLDIEHTVMLYKNLLLNYHDILSALFEKSTVVYCFDENDFNFLSDEIAAHKDLVFYNRHSPESLIKQISERYLAQNQYNLFISSNSIAITLNKIKKLFSVLSVEDNLIILGQSKNNKLALAALNYPNAEFLVSLNFNDEEFESALKKACINETGIHRYTGFLKINTLTDFKDLYKELSKKESLAYCSQRMHEQFTHLFIEYKDLLK